MSPAVKDALGNQFVLDEDSYTQLSTITAALSKGKIKSLAGLYFAQRPSQALHQTASVEEDTKNATPRVIKPAGTPILEATVQPSILLKLDAKTMTATENLILCCSPDLPMCQLCNTRATKEYVGGGPHKKMVELLWRIEHRHLSAFKQKCKGSSLHP